MKIISKEQLSLMGRFFAAVIACLLAGKWFIWVETWLSPLPIALWLWVFGTLAVLISINKNQQYRDRDDYLRGMFLNATIVVIWPVLAIFVVLEMAAVMLDESIDVNPYS